MFLPFIPKCRHTKLCASTTVEQSRKRTVIDKENSVAQNLHKKGCDYADNIVQDRDATRKLISSLSNR